MQIISKNNPYFNFCRKWTSRQVDELDQLTSRQVTCNKEEICSHVTMSYFEVDELTS